MSKKNIMGILVTFYFLISFTTSYSATVAGYPYYVIPETSTQVQIDYGYTLKFIWIDPSDNSVHIIAGDGGPISIDYAMDGGYSVEFDAETEELDLYLAILPPNDKQDAYYASYDPCVLDIANAVTMVPSLVGGTFNPGAVGKEIVERPGGFRVSITGNLTFPGSINSGDKLPTIISVYQDEHLITSSAQSHNYYKLNVFPEGVYKLIFSRPGFKTESIRVDIPHLNDIEIVRDILFQDNFKGSSTILNVPKNFSLNQNYPNPFNPATQISFSLPKDARVTLKVFDVSGKEVARLLNNEFRTANSYSVQFNGVNLSSGVYFYTLETDGFKDTKKMMLIK